MNQEKFYVREEWTVYEMDREAYLRYLKAYIAWWARDFVSDGPPYPQAADFGRRLPIDVELGNSSFIEVEQMIQILEGSC